MAESEKGPKLEEGGIFVRNMIEGDSNPDIQIMRNVCEVRAHIRNKFRVPILETTGLLFSKIPDVSYAHEILEEEVRLLFRARRNLRMGVFAEVNDAYGEALRYHARKEGTEDVYNEEYGKYLAGSVIRDWRKQGADGGLKSLRHIKGKSYIAEEIRSIAVDEALFEIKSYLLSKIQNGEYVCAVDGMMKIAEEKSMQKGDLLDLGMSSKEEEGLLEYLDQFMPILIHMNPRIYEATSAFFEKMGFDAVRWQTSEGMKTTVKAIILGSLEGGICYLDEVLDEFERMKLVDIVEVRKWREFNDVIDIKLGEAMSMSPDAYVQVRNQYVQLQLITAEKADMMNHVRSGLQIFFESLKQDTSEVVTYSYSKHLCGLGVKTPIGDSVCEKWRDYEDIEKTYGQDVLEYEIGRDKAEEMMKMLADRADRFLSADKSYDLTVFNKVRGQYTKNLAVFLGKFPYFKRCFPDFRVDSVVSEDVDEGDE